MTLRSHAGIVLPCALVGGTRLVILAQRGIGEPAPVAAFVVEQPAQVLGVLDEIGLEVAFLTAAATIAHARTKREPRSVRTASRKP